MKKVFAICLAVMLLAGVLAMPASAADTVPVRVYIDGPAQIKAGETAAVSLYVNGNTGSGGVFGIIHYDPAAMTYQGVTLREDVILLENTAEVTYRVDETAGTIRFVLVSNISGGTAPADAWMTVNFKLKSSAAGAKATVTLTDVKTSNMAGDAELTPTVIGNDTVTLVADSNLYTNLLGATIKTDIAKQGIRFESAKTTLAMSGLTEAGVVMYPTVLLYEGQDLTKETIGKGGTKPVVAKTTDADDLTAIANGNSLFATLTNGTTGGRANVAITARSYVVINGLTIYSHNTSASPAVDCGEADRSLVSVAKAIAEKEIDGGAVETAEITAILGATTLNDTQVTALLTFCRDNISCLKENA